MLARIAKEVHQRSSHVAGLASDGCDLGAGADLDVALAGLLPVARLRQRILEPGFRGHHLLDDRGHAPLQPGVVQELGGEVRDLRNVPLHPREVAILGCGIRFLEREGMAELEAGDGRA